jgi:Rrf2 family protein
MIHFRCGSAETRKRLVAMLSTTAEYALRAVLHIAEVAGEGSVPVERIAEALNQPRNYLSKILHTLVRPGVLESTRGPRGGFRLAVPAEELTLLDVVRVFDPLDERRSCLLGRPFCSDVNPCPVHHRWKDVAERAAAFFRDTTVAEVLENPGKAAVLREID